MWIGTMDALDLLKQLHKHPLARFEHPLAKQQLKIQSLPLELAPFDLRPQGTKVKATFLGMSSPDIHGQAA